MPTLATGADRRRRGEAGFTLVELMVVVVIIGLAASVAVLSAPSGGGLAKDAERFGARLVRAKEEAVLTNRPVAVEITPRGYGFRTRTRDGWKPLAEGPFKPATWGEGVVVATGARDERAQVAFQATGTAEPLVVTLSRKSRRVRVSVDAAGNVSVDAV